MPAGVVAEILSVVSKNGRYQAVVIEQRRDKRPIHVEEREFCFPHGVRFYSPPSGFLAGWPAATISAIMPAISVLV